MPELDTDFDPLSPAQLAPVFKAWEESAADYKAKEKRRVESARRFLTGDEYRLVDDRNFDGIKLQLKEAKKKIDRIVASVTERPHDIRIIARELASFPPGHPFGEFLAQMGAMLGISPEQDAAIVSEVLTLAVKSLGGALKFEKKLERLVEWSLTDRCCYLKDGVDPADPDFVTLDVVQATDVTHAPDVYDVDDSPWWIHTVELSYKDAKRLIPDLPKYGKSSAGEGRLLPDTAARGDRALHGQGGALPL
jgi:hypothetical protein